MRAPEVELTPVGTVPGVATAAEANATEAASSGALEEPPEASDGRTWVVSRALSDELTLGGPVLEMRPVSGTKAAEAASSEPLEGAPEGPDGPVPVLLGWR